MKIYLTAIIRSKPEFLQEVSKVLQNMVVQTRKEPASLQYDLHQSTEDENVFVFYEIWADQAGLDLHNSQPYLQEFQKMASEKLVSLPEVYLSKKLG